MIVGHPDELCVTLDTPGVPNDGSRYGKPRWFARQMKALGYVLAWNLLWERFEMFRRLASGRLIHEWGFSREGGTEPQPITEEHAMVFRFLRARYPNSRTVRSAYARMARDEREDRHAAMKREFDEIEPIVTRKTQLKMGLGTPRTAIVVPQLPFVH